MKYKLIIKQKHKKYLIILNLIDYSVFKNFSLQEKLFIDSSKF